jgi:hypothetical protein
LRLALAAVVALVLAAPARALVAAHVPTALHVYPNGTHGWPGPQFDAGLAWTLSFLKKYL